MSKVNTNVCIITGNVTRDAELRYTSTQKPVLGFTVACNRQGPDGQSAADFFPVVLWGKSAEALEKYLTKGKSVLVKGRLQTRSYESKTGEKRNVTEIIADSFGGIELLGGGDRKENQSNENTERLRNGYVTGNKTNNKNDWNPMNVDDIPEGGKSDIPF